MAAKHICLIAAALVLGGLTADAQTVVMQALPADDSAGRPVTLHVLSPGDHDLYVRAYADAARGNWTDALALGNQGQDSLARQLLQWRYALDRNSGATFAQIDAALKMAADWPLKNTLYARAEAAITPDMSPTQIVTWFGGRTPASSIGRVRLGEALVATGQTAKGAALIRQGWIDGSFDETTLAGILAKDASYLTPESDKARLDALLWQDQIAQARQELPRVDAGTAALAQARIALAAGLPHARPYLEKVPGSKDPTLLYDWARQLRMDHQDQAAYAKLLAASPTALARDHTARWWNEINAEARNALAAGDARTALALVDHAMLPVSDQYAEQQFLGGFIALRFLKDPARALVYFRQLGANVSRPISKSRAEYWQGRADEALGDNASAITHYRLAATYPETFYGQLAMARTQTAPVLHLNDTEAAAVAKADIENDPLMPQMRVLADLGQAGDLRLFAEKEAETYPAPAHLRQFLQSLADWGYPEIAVRLAKSSSYVGAPMLALAYPVRAVPQGPTNAVLVHALIRQETEFDSYAVSSAGARGLMQMMPASAKKAAHDGGLPYRPDALLADQQYNIQLGEIEFAGHLSDWGGSYVLATASYNAGPANVKKWLAANGDPRGGVDPIDWIEQIPFSETRNYVQRVLENVEVYRNRLQGADQPLQILSDLYAPATPPDTVLSATNAPARGKAN